MATHMTFPACITACSEEPAMRGFYRFNSRWDGTLNGQCVTVFAGVLEGNPKQGVLLVRTMPDDHLRKRGRQVNGPAGAGTLRLVGWAGARIKVLAESGDAVWFEVPHRRIPARAHIA